DRRESVLTRPSVAEPCVVGSKQRTNRGDSPISHAGARSIAGRCIKCTPRLSASPPGTQRPISVGPAWDRPPRAEAWDRGLRLLGLVRLLDEGFLGRVLGRQDAIE